MRVESPSDLASMCSNLRSADKNVYLVGSVSHQILGCKLPSNKQVLSVLFYNLREVKLSLAESANLVIRECLIFWEKARIPTRSLLHCQEKLIKLHSHWRNLQRNSRRSSETQRERENEFISDLNNLFDIAHANALDLMKIEEDKIFLQLQREPGRKGCLAGIDKRAMKREERSLERAMKFDERRAKEQARCQGDIQFNLESSSEELDTSDVPSSSLSLPCPAQATEPAEGNSNEPDIVMRGRKCIFTTKLMAALDRCQISQRNAVFILEAAIEAAGLDIADVALNRTSLQRYRERFRKNNCLKIKQIFQEKVPKFVTVHWDSKLLPALNVRDPKQERLPVIVSYDGNKDKLLGVPTLENSSGREQASAVWTALGDWGLQEKVQILCSDTTASNTGRFSGAVTYLEQYAERELIYFPCRHHMYELVLRSVFEQEFSKASCSPDIAYFKKIRDQWNTLDHENYITGQNYLKKILDEQEHANITNYLYDALQNKNLKHDYRELTELCIVFIGKDPEQDYKIKPPGALHHARWMAKALYSFKMFFFSRQLA